MQPVTVTQFQDHIFHGRWDAALALLPRLTYDPNVALQAGVSLVTYWVIAPTALHSHSGHCCRACSACVLYVQCGDAGILMLAAGSLPDHPAEICRGCGGRTHERCSAHPEKRAGTPEDK
jgi:hypothetical protein